MRWCPQWEMNCKADSCSELPLYHPKDKCIEYNQSQENLKMDNRKIGLTSGNNFKEVIDDIRKEMGLPDDDLIVILHIPRKDLDKLEGALQLAGYKGQTEILRPTERL